MIQGHRATSRSIMNGPSRIVMRDVFDSISSDNYHTQYEDYQ
jgi:hypothetical protein